MRLQAKHPRKSPKSHYYRSVPTEDGSEYDNKCDVIRRPRGYTQTIEFQFYFDRITLRDVTIEQRDSSDAGLAHAAESMAAYSTLVPVVGQVIGKGLLARRMIEDLDRLISGHEDEDNLRVRRGASDVVYRSARHPEYGHQRNRSSVELGEFGDWELHEGGLKCTRASEIARRANEAAEMWERKREDKTTGWR